MPLPDHDPNTGYLPPGDHDATLDEVIARYSRGLQRKKLCEGLRQVVTELRARGVTRICVDGSFASSRKRPSDVDVWYEPPPGTSPTTWGRLSPAERAQLKADTDVDLCKHPMRAGFTKRGGYDPTPLPDYWRTKYGVVKGLIWLSGGEE